MKDADAWVADGERHLETSWHTDYHSELIAELTAAVAAFEKALKLEPGHVEASRQKGLALERLSTVGHDAQAPEEPAKAHEKVSAPAPPKSEPKLRCPECFSDHVVSQSAHEAYELKCESCGHSEVFVVTDFPRESDSHWLG
jgi:ribosomal protein S27E